MLTDICNDTKSQMDKSLESFKKQLASIRTGRAHISLLDGIKVDYYGSISPINQVASVTVADSQTLAVKPWDKSMLKVLEKSIMEANLGLVPMNDGDFIRIPIPTLTEQRRREFVKQAKQKCEDAKISIRNARRDANEMLKDATKSKDISEDEEKRGLKMIQDMTDKHVHEAETIFLHKEKEILSV
ncbi:ribosome recycling factor [Sulfobacillus acidophilus]|uniref:Ribosome-recycling factor n=1 Tax=Sulfobacillus acidophilus TaxID=53633 RepID=A0ABS3AWD0_9FIRM|nr:ribosome recycling factor [Sulfobacillus acidophilus]